MDKICKPKFKVGDIVWMKDEFHFNPANKVISIGQIQAIHIYKGKSLFSDKTKEGTFEQKDYFGRVTYTVSGFSLQPEEKDLRPFAGEI